ncbi:MAG: hypothetical protein J5795_01265 [Lachnospiraceae bacterium]|nr:hypothetical protein [Lachnospiraceae bacterium]
MMRSFRKNRLLLLVFLLCTLTACGWRGRKETIPDPEPTEPVAEGPTYTPTPFVSKDPVETDVDTNAISLIPDFSQNENPIWELSPKIPISNSVNGRGTTEAYYQLYYEPHALYVRVCVNDGTPSTGDKVVFYLNESGKKPAKYGVGDCFCSVDRNNNVQYGTGCDPAKIKTKTSSYGESYAVEIMLPLLSVTAQKGTEIGFDAAVYDYSGNTLVRHLQWSDTSGRTDTTLQGVGTIDFE